MAAPRTWVTSELVTAAIMNAHVRDMFNLLAQAKPIAIPIGDPGGAVITTGEKMRIYIPDGIRPTGWTLLSDVAGSLVLDLWVDSYLNDPPTVADSITGSEKPTLSGVMKNQDLTLGTWSDIPSGSVMTLYVQSCTAIKQATLTLGGTLLAML